MIRHDPALQFSTYSIVARDPESGQFGVGVQTHQMCVGAVVPWLSPGIGALATQASANVHFGPMGMALLGQGQSASMVVDALVATDEGAHRRQLAVVDRKGNAAAWTGKNCIPVADHLIGDGYSVQANMMLNPGVVKAMAKAYQESSNDFASRILEALEAAQELSGDIRGMQSAAIKIVEGKGFNEEGQAHVLPRFDLRVDEHQDPIQELSRLVRYKRAEWISAEGYKKLEEGDLDQALVQWKEARDLAPELEELAFWQAETLADGDYDLKLAAEILQPVLEQLSNKEDWFDLLRRLEQCGLLEKKGAAEALISAMGF